MTTNIARNIDILAAAFALGTTVWFFFIQSPVLIKRLGRDQFVPLQMRLTRVLFRSLSVALVIMVGAAITHAASLFSLSVLAAAFGLTGALINTYVILPRALRAGGHSLRELRGRSTQASVAQFASEGAGSAAKFWHRMVVVFVVVMLAGLFPHMCSLVSL